MNQIAKLYQTKCIQLQEQIENLERLLEAAQTSPLSDKEFAQATAAAQEKQAEEVKQEEEKKKEEEAAKPPTPDNFVGRTSEKYPAFYQYGKNVIGTLIAMQALPRLGGKEMEKGTPAQVETTTTKNAKGKPVTSYKVVSSKPSVRGSLTTPLQNYPLIGRIPLLKYLPVGLFHGAAEAVDVLGQNKAISATDPIAAAEVEAKKELPILKKDLSMAKAARAAIPPIPAFAAELAKASDTVDAKERALRWQEQTIKSAERETLEAQLKAADRVKNQGMLSRGIRAGGGVAAAVAAPGIDQALFDILSTDTPKQALSAAPAVLPAQGMVGSEVAAKAKDLARKTASAGGKALGFLSPLETAASEVVGIGARALGLGAEVAGAAVMAPLAIGAITRSAGGTEMRGSIEGMPFPPGVNSMEEYDEYLEKQRKQQNASSVQSLVGRGYNPEGRSATQRQ
jgi:hypothetical protein